MVASLRSAWSGRNWLGWCLSLALLASPAEAVFKGQTVSLRKFDGLNDTAVSTNIADNESPDLLNVRFPLGAIQKRLGFSKLDDDQVSSTNAIQALKQVTFSSGTKRLIAISNGQYKYLNAGSWTNISGSVTSGATAGGEWHDIAMFTDLVISSDDEARIVSWSGSGNFAALSGSPPTSARAIEPYRNYLILGNTIESGTRYPTRVRWSALNSAVSWPAANFNTILNNVGDQIMSLEHMDDSLYIFMRYSIWRMDYTGNATVPFHFTNVCPNRGAISRTGQALVENAIFFASDDGMYVFTGGQPQRISERVEVGWDARNKAKDGEVVALHNDQYDEVWFCYAEGGSTSNDAVLVYDYSSDSWSRFGGIDVCSGTNYSDDNGYYLISGAYDTGYVYKQNDTVNDDGAAISSYYKTKWLDLGDSMRYKQVKKIQMEANTESGDSEVDLDYFYDFRSAGRRLTYALQSSSFVFGNNNGVAEGDEAVFGIATFGATGEPTIIEKPSADRGRFVQIKIGNMDVGESFTVFGISMGVLNEDL